MDDHVLRTYSTKSLEARHYVQYDQGEDRWLCTLLLQEGYRVEYCAASDALTYAPETFHVRSFSSVDEGEHLCLGIFQSTSPVGSIDHRQHHRFSR